MSLLKKLISDTAIYGTSSILARGLNTLLTFFIADIVATAEFGVFTQLYAIVAFLLVVLTHGMETSFFRHVNIYEKNKNIFSAAFISVGILSATFLVLTLFFLKPIAIALKYPDQQNYISIFAFIIFFDVISAVPFANLRHLGKAKRFAAIKVFSILLTIGLNVFFLMICPKLVESHNFQETGIGSWYRPENKVAYVFIANLIASAITFILLSPQVLKISFKIEKSVFKRMLLYALPIMLLGFAGTINEMLDRFILRDYLPYDDIKNLEQLGIYGFAYKLSMIMSLFLQAYKYAVEPILFSEVHSESAQKTYASIMKYYLVAICLLFIIMLFNLPLIKYILFDVIHYNEDYLAAFKLVPILLGANAFLGIYFNIATWYKVTDNTMYGAYIAIFGAIITILLNLIFVPLYGIAASAWATLICYLAMTILGLWVGQKHYPIPYHFSRLLLYIALTIGILLLYLFIWNQSFYYLSGLAIIICIVFVSIVYKLEKKTS